MHALSPTHPFGSASSRTSCAPVCSPPASSISSACSRSSITYLSRALNRPREETARHIEATDRDRAEFVREHFRRDVADPRNYDLVLNTSRFTVAECADLIIESLRRLESHAARGEPALAR